MKDIVRVSLVQFAPVALDREENAERMAGFVASECTNHGADLVVFPELATTGYVRPHYDAKFSARLYAESEPVPGPTTSRLGELTLRYRCYVITGLSQSHSTIPHTLFNSAAIIAPDGEVAGVHQKVHSCLDEKNYFARGNNIDVYETGLGKIAVNICYDVRFPELARLQALRGAEIIVSIWASFEQPGKVPSDTIYQRCATRAMENAVFFLGCNRAGTENDRVFYGRSAIAAPSGEIIAASTTSDEEVVRGELRADVLARQREYLTIFADRRPELYSELTDPL
jgi:predicted amidohydrolase